MKAFTDLEQSKKLAEILEWKTADMTWANVYENNVLIDHKLEITPFRFYQGIGVPAWSLAALHDILSRYCNRLEITLRVDKRYNIFAVSGDCIYRSFDIHPKGIDNLIDACYEMIIKLNELKML